MIDGAERMKVEGRVQAVERFPNGKFREGDEVRLRRPGAQNLFENPRGVLTVVAVNWFRAYEPPTYALQEAGGVAVTPFRDEDLRKARRGVRARTGKGLAS